MRTEMGIRFSPVSRRDIDYGEDTISEKPSKERGHFSVERKLKDGATFFGVSHDDWAEHEVYRTRSEAIDGARKLRKNFHWGGSFHFRVVHVTTR
jgi:hypothetical protein